MFRDECEIEVAAGRGGDGMASFRREKYVARGGPDGGDGGNGGDVVLLATSRKTSLLSIGRRRRYGAKNGRPGETGDRSGARGEDLVLEVPLGTQVFDARRGNLLRDLAEDEQRLVLAAGGRGGRGNAHFKNSVRQTPRHAERGREGESRTVRLELKLLADVGLVGLPNAGKSTFLAAVSAARPKIAGYPFTTLEPHVGIVEVRDYDTLCIADLPGLIEGAAAGEGLGHQFLKHVERCRVLLHLVDVSERDAAGAAEDLAVIERELERYSSELARRERLIVATKVESEQAEQVAEELAAACGREVHRISSHSKRGVDELLTAVHARVRGVESF